MREVVSSIIVGNCEIQIQYDRFPSNPRRNSNVGIIAVEPSNRYIESETPHTIRFSVDPAVDLEVLKTDFGARVIVPLYVLDHSGVSFRTTPFCDPWDSGQIGWVYATDETIRTCLGDVDLTCDTQVQRVKQAMSEEIEEFNSYYNGEVFRYFVYDRLDPAADPMDECGGYYTIDEARQGALNFVEWLQKVSDRREFPLFQAMGLPVPPRDTMLTARLN